MKMTFTEYEQSNENYDDYCSNCDAITRWGETEPDARGIECDDCGQKKVMGVDWAFVGGKIILEEDE